MEITDVNHPIRLKPSETSVKRSKTGPETNFLFNSEMNKDNKQKAVLTFYGYIVSRIKIHIQNIHKVTVFYGNSDGVPPALNSAGFIG